MEESGFFRRSSWQAPQVDDPYAPLVGRLESGGPGGVRERSNGMLCAICIAVVLLILATLFAGLVAAKGGVSPAMRAIVEGDIWPVVRLVTSPNAGPESFLQRADQEERLRRWIRDNIPNGWPKGDAPFPDIIGTLPGQDPEVVLPGMLDDPNFRFKADLYKLEEISPMFDKALTIVAGNFADGSKGGSKYYHQCSGRFFLFEAYNLHRKIQPHLPEVTQQFSFSSLMPGAGPDGPAQKKALDDILEELKGQTGCEEGPIKMLRYAITRGYIVGGIESLEPGIAESEVPIIILDVLALRSPECPVPVVLWIEGAQHPVAVTLAKSPKTVLDAALESKKIVHEGRVINERSDFHILSHQGHGYHELYGTSPIYTRFTDIEIDILWRGIKSETKVAIDNRMKLLENSIVTANNPKRACGLVDGGESDISCAGAQAKGK